MGFELGRSVGKYNRVFSGTFFTLRGFQVFSGISGYIGYHLSGREPNIKFFSNMSGNAQNFG